MADSENIFDQIGPDVSPSIAPVAATPSPVEQSSSDNPFDAIGPDVQEATSATGAFMRSAARGLAPAIGSIPAMGLGAEVGATGGAAIGSAVPVVGTAIGGVVGGIVGGIAGGIGGATAINAGQDWALSKLPDSMQRMLGQDEGTRSLDQRLHPTASFLGGIAPYALTMRPGGLSAAEAALPANATGFMRLMANPMTSRIFGGAMQGGIEAAQEKLHGGDLDWRNVAIATAFGLVFNQPTRLGETLTGAGAKLSPFHPPEVSPQSGPTIEAAKTLNPEEPTVAQAADLKVMGPGITEDVFQGIHAQSPETMETAQSAARLEQAQFGPVPEPDLHAAARRIEPELFDRYDQLSQQRDEFRNWISEYNNPPPEDFAAAQKTVTDLQTQLDAHLQAQNGYQGGPEARRLRAQLREAQSDLQELHDRQTAFTEGRAQETPDLQMARQHLQAVDYQMRDMAADVSAAYRRAADLAGHGIEPETATPDKAPAAMPTMEEDRSQIREELNNYLNSMSLESGETAANHKNVMGIAINSPDRMEAFRAGMEEALTGVTAKKFLDRANNILYETGKAMTTAKMKDLSVEPGIATAETVAAQPAPGAPEARPVEEQLAYIASDITQKLIKAGRPADEAEAAGQLLAARYQTRADRLGGAIGTPEALYNAEGPEVKAGRGRPAKATQEAEMAQRMQGKISIRDDAKPIITLAKTADASTFIHETGHQWLEELMRDARHDLAPDLLKTDAKTVRDWIGAADGETIKTRQHEKFARGFEQYMREGIAPTPQLASVFSKFRTWLVNIYQTLKGLGQPISPDIAGVFDRLIATEPRRTVYAPERETTSTLADLHEADARETHPAEADAALDRVNSEKTQYIQDQSPEVINELENAYRESTAAKPSGEGDQGASRPGQVEQGGGEPEAQPGSGTGGEEHGTLIPRRNEAGAEGNGVSGRGGSTGAGTGASTLSGPEQRPVSGGENGNPLAPGPSDRIASAESRIVDKAGNIRLDNIKGPEDIKQAMREIADANEGFMGQRQQISDGQVLDFANKLLGEDPDMSMSRSIKATVLSSNVKAAQKLLADAASEVSRLSRAVADSGTDADVMAFAQAHQKLTLVQGYYSGAQAEVARAFRALAKTEEYWSPEAKAIDAATRAQPDVNQTAKDATGRDLFQLRQMAEAMATLDTPEKIAKFARDARKRSFGGMLLEYYINNLISGPISHTTYAVGNMATAIENAIFVTPVASALSSAHRLLGGEGGVYAGEVLARLRGLWRGLPQGLEASLAALKSGVGTVLPGDHSHQSFYAGDFPTYLGHQMTDVETKWKDVATQAFGLVQGIHDAMLTQTSSSRGFALKYSPTGQIPDITVGGRNLLPVGNLLRMPGRAVGAFDSFFKAMNYSAEKSARAYRMAMDEGLSGAEFNARVADIRQNPSEEIMHESAKQASMATLMGPSGDFMNKLTPLLNSEVTLPVIGAIRPVRFIVPFAKVASQVLDSTIVQRTPVGLLSSELRADLFGKNGPAARDIAQARMLTGGVISMGISSLVAMGNLTGSGPRDPREAAVWRQAGYQPYSVKIGSTWYSYRRLEPLGFLIGTIADFTETLHEAEEGDALHAASALTIAVGENLLDSSFMKGPADLVRAIMDPERYGSSWVSGFASGFLPFSTLESQWARTIDPYSRRAKGIVDSMKSRIPYMSQTLYPRRDIWGAPLPSTEGFGGITNIYVKQANDDPVNHALLNLHVYPGALEDKIRNVKLTDQQYDDFSRIAGRLAKNQLDWLVKSQNWTYMTDDDKRLAINNVLSGNREAARNLIMAKYPDIPRQAAILQNARRRGELPVKK